MTNVQLHDEAESGTRPSQLINDYLQKCSGTFRELQNLRERGWSNTEADKHFEKQRSQADEAGPAQRLMFFEMMCRLGEDIQNSTGAIALANTAPFILDLCAAPGGFIACARRYNPAASISAISLPTTLGGHPLLVPQGTASPRITVEYLDITMLGSEYGLDPRQCDIPTLSAHRPYHGQSFDLVFCDGQVLRTHTQHLDEVRARFEPRRLSCSQMIMALQRIRDGGTLIMLLHKVESWNTLQTLHAFSGFASIQLYKPSKCHATRSSFYLIATGVRPTSLAAQIAIRTWKTIWKEATVGTIGANQEGLFIVSSAEVGGKVNKLLEEFGSQFVQLAEPIWCIQRDALSRKSWTK